MSQETITDMNEEQAAMKEFCEQRLSGIFRHAVTIDIKVASGEKQAEFYEGQQKYLKAWMAKQSESMSEE